MADARRATKELREEHGVTYGAYGDTAACKSCLYPLRRKIPILPLLPRVTAIKKTTAAKVHGERKNHTR